MKCLIFPVCILAMAGVAFCTENNNTFIFIQEASSGSFVDNGSGNYTLTMNDVIPYTVFFADRPARDAGFAPMDKFLEGFGFGDRNPPMPQ